MHNSNRSLSVWKTTQKHKTDSQKEITTKRANIVVIRFTVTGLRESETGLSFRNLNQIVVNTSFSDTNNIVMFMCHAF